jgi:hypothetical protein
MIKHALAAGILAERLDRADAMRRASQMLMRLGVFERAWQLSRASLRERRQISLPEWTGDSLSGRTVLIWPHESHVGKEIRCARFIAPVAARAHHCIVLAERRLVPILRRSFENVDVRTRGVDDERSLADADIFATFETLGLHLAKTADDLQRSFVPLRADPELVAQFRRRYRIDGRDCPLIGISWWSSSGKKDLPSLRDWLPLIARRQTTFVSLQYDYRTLTSDLAVLRRLASGQIIDDPSVDQLVDLDCFAAQVAALDAVVTVSNTTVHVAGDFGIPAVLIRDDRFYGIWPLAGPTPWYPSIAIVYKNGRAWVDVFSEARERLEQLLASNQTAPRSASEALIEIRRTKQPAS